MRRLTSREGVEILVEESCLVYSQPGLEVVFELDGDCDVRCAVRDVSGEELSGLISHQNSDLGISIFNGSSNGSRNDSKTRLKDLVEVLVELGSRLIPLVELFPSSPLARKILRFLTLLKRLLDR